MTDIQIHLTQYLSENRIDLFLIYGDRAEALAAALACLHTNTLYWHMQAGDHTGTHDDTMRQMIERGAAWHFCSNEQSADRLLDSGISAFLITGDQHLDAFIFDDLFSISNPHKPFNPYAVLHMHPDPSDHSARAVRHTQMCIDACIADNLEIVAIYPCSDPGCEAIIEVLNRNRGPRMHVYKNIPGWEYRNLLKYADICIGNSSSFVIETPFIGIRSLVIGSRQAGRSMDSDFVTFLLDPDSSAEVAHYLKDRLELPRPIENSTLYGTGAANADIYGFIKQEFEL